MKKKLYKIYFVGFLLIPIILLILPANFFDTGKSICLSVLFFKSECYACGLTRAIQHFIHFDFVTGYNFNKLSIIVFPLLIYLYYIEIKRICLLLR